MATKRKAAAAVEAPAGKFPKAYLMKKYAKYSYVLAAALRDGKEYTTAQAEAAIKSFLEREVH